MKEPITYSEREQTPAQRQELIEKARAWSAAQGAVPGPFAEAVYARYVAGKLTLQGVTDELKSYYATRTAAPAGVGSTVTPQGMMQPEEPLLG